MSASSSTSRHGNGSSRTASCRNGSSSCIGATSPAPTRCEHVRALFVIGRPLASPEDVTRQTEALFGDISHSGSTATRRKHGRIPIVPDAKGNNTIRVDVREMADPMGQRVRRQIREAAIIQAAGRARAGLRGDDEPLDLHLWTDVPVPELGPVEPVLWSELEAGLDGLMLASGGVWLESHRTLAKPTTVCSRSMGSSRVGRRDVGVP